MQLLPSTPNTKWPLARPDLVDHARALCRDDASVIGIVDLDRAEADLMAGELACPECGGVLRRWDTAGRGGSATTAVRRWPCDPAGPAALRAERPRCCCPGSCFRGGPTRPR